MAKGRIVEEILKRDQIIKDELRIISISPELPDNTLYIRKDLPLKLKLDIQQVLLDMNKDPEGRNVLKNYSSSRFIEAKSKDFDLVRKMARRCGIDIKNFRYDYQ